MNIFYDCMNYIFRSASINSIFSPFNFYFGPMIITSKLIYIYIYIHSADKNNVTFGTDNRLSFSSHVYFCVSFKIKSRSLHCQMIATANGCESAKSDIIFFGFIRLLYISFSKLISHNANIEYAGVLCMCVRLNELTRIALNCQFCFNAWNDGQASAQIK